MLHVWHIYLQNWLIFGVNVGKYSIHGAYGSGKRLHNELENDKDPPFSMGNSM